MKPNANGKKKHTFFYLMNLFMRYLYMSILFIAYIDVEIKLLFLSDCFWHLTIIEYNTIEYKSDRRIIKLIAFLYCNELHCNLAKAIKRNLLYNR